MGMDSYIEQSHMQSLGAWATEIEIIAAPHCFRQQYMSMDHVGR